MAKRTETDKTEKSRKTPRKRKRPLRMRLRARSGSAALEFAMIAPVLFLLLMGTIEAGILFIGKFTLQNAINESARLIRTGQVADGEITQAQFRQNVCDNLGPILSCDSNLQIDVESFSGFGSLSYADPLNADGTLNTGLNNFSTGDVCSVVLVRGFYTWNVATPLLTPFMTNMSGNKFLMSAAAAFRNEPYNTSVSGC